MNCCEKCIGDALLQEQFFNTSQDVDLCPSCGSPGQRLIEASALRDSFELLFNIYIEGEGGRPLLDWIKEDWGLFGLPSMDVARSNNLLAAILDDPGISAKSFRLSERCDTGAVDGWDQLRTALMHQNRFFPKADFDIEQLRAFLPDLQIPPPHLEWFRGRIQEGADPYSAEEMGAPPKDKAAHGRANPNGIRYLYLASNENTAVAELRPHTGDRVSVARCTIIDNLKVVNLQHPRRSISPFKQDEKLEDRRGVIGLLDRLGEELTRPIVPHAAAIHYIPTQYLCEFIKSCGYDGVLYRSSVGGGVNLALFNPDHGNVTAIVPRTISRVIVEVHE